MTSTGKQKFENIFSWIFAMIFCPFGVSFAIKSAFGVSMIEAPVYVLHLKVAQFWSWFTYGTSEYVLQAILLVAMCLVIRKFKWEYLLSFVTGFLYGQVLDFWNRLFRNLPADTVVLRIVYALIGIIFVAFSVANFFRTSLPLAVWELFVKEISERFGFNITKCKWIYDFSSLVAGIVLMLTLFGRFRLDVIGIGTLVTTLVNAPVIGFSSKILDKIWSRLPLKKETN